MVYKYDFLIIGAGVAGMSYALKVAEANKGKVCMICKAGLDEANTSFAQGGVASVTNMKVDTFDKHIADTIIASTANIVITGEGMLVAEGTVPIIGTPDATITFEANMHVRSLPSAAAVRRRIRDAKFGKKLDETGGPALSGFGSSDFSKVNVSPSGASYGEAATINALYTLNGQGEKVIVTEFETTLIATGAGNARERKALDSTKPMYNILGMQVDAKYKGIVVQDGQKYLLQ